MFVGYHVPGPSLNIEYHPSAGAVLLVILTTAGRTRLTITLKPGLGVGAGMGVAVGRGIAVAVGWGVGVGVGVGSGVGVAVGRGTGVAVGWGVGTGVGAGIGVGGIAAIVAAMPASIVALMSGVAVGVAVGSACATPVWTVAPTSWVGGGTSTVGEHAARAMVRTKSPKANRVFFNVMWLSYYTGQATFSRKIPPGIQRAA